MATVGQIRTADELLRLPDDGMRHELVRGELRTMTPAGASHGAVAVRLAARLAGYVEANALGLVFAAETGFKLETDPDTVRAPDVGFVRRERVPASGPPSGYWPGPPDLAVEVLSPGDTRFEVESKTRDWLAAGTRAVWIVDPRSRTVTIHERGVAPRLLAERDVLEGGAVVPGFRVAVADVFAYATAGVR